MGKNKLTETQVREIIEWVISSPLNGVQVAAKYGISPVQLRAILHLRAWPHLQHSGDTITTNPTPYTHAATAATVTAISYTHWSFYLNHRHTKGRGGG